MKANRLTCLSLVLMLAVAGCKKKPTATTSPLHWAAREGHTEAVGLLISSGADLNAKGPKGWTPLFLALSKGSGDLIAMLLAQGADANVRCGTWGETPLRHAAHEGLTNMVRPLLAGGSDVNAESRYGRTPLHTAIQSNQQEIAELFIAKGANIYAGTPLNEAIRAGHSPRETMTLE